MRTRDHSVSFRHHGSTGLSLVLTLIACVGLGTACSKSEPAKPRTDGGAGSGGGDGPRVDAPSDFPGGADRGGDVPGTPNPGDAAGGAGGIMPPPGLVEGVACGMGSECRSGFCVDGVCCDGACTGTCLSCAVQGSVGSCVPADVGTDPRDQCADDGLTTCGRDGVCDGAGACRKYPAGAVCKAASCSGSTMTLVSRCDGMGVCTPAASQTCAPFACEGATACGTTCTTDANCSAPNTCVSGSCGKKPLGATCSEATQCNSGFCEQGVCCGAACSGICRSCALPGTAGACTTVPAGADPLGQCADTGATTCGADGVCNGAGACRIYASGTICGAASCTDTTESGTRRCDGAGMCGMAPTRSCAPFRCGTGGSCPTTCTTNAQCVANNFCIGGTCKKKVGGAACAAAAECGSGFCQQGVCCDKACGSACQACNLAGSEGTCSPIPAGMDPMNQCEPTAATTCGTDGQCDGKGACRLFASGTVCKALECSGSTQTLASRCNGTGTCVAAGTQTCAPFLCGTAGACKGTCASNADCSAGNVCTGTSCGKKPPGATCGAGTECQSTFCQQGVCCATACTDNCKSCALPSSEGTCEFVPAGEDPLTQCADEGAAGCKKDGTCDGAGVCRTYAAGTSCAAATCTGSTLTSERTCNGSGTCQMASTSMCGNYACDTNGTCRQACTADAHCSGVNVCNAGVCSKKLNGVACGAANECQSNFCQQGFCCESSCTGNCRSCGLPGAARGVCTVVPSNQDPENHCTVADPTSCDNDGTCDGAGNCKLYASGTVCGPATCSNNTATPAPKCNGTGNCVAASPTACNPFQCNATACHDTCTTNAQCQSPNICNIVNGVGTCGGKPNGGTCGNGSECASNNCAQGRCCATACAGGCRSCALPGNEGTCAVVPAGQDPLDACNDTGAAACGSDGSCNGSGACRIYAAGTSCAAASCTNAMSTPARTCTGTGTGACMTVTPVSCGKYQCNGAVCRTTCGSTADCTGSSVCAGGVCGGLKGEYYDNANFTTLRVTRTDPTVDFDWAFGSPDPSIGVDDFSVRWTGSVTPFTTQVYTFVTYSDDAVQLWVNNVLVISNTAPHSVARNTGNIMLNANQSYSIRMEFVENTMHAVAKLYWQAPSFTERVIPTAQLTPAP